VHLLFVDDDNDICQAVADWIEDIKDERGNKRVSHLTIVHDKKNALDKIRKALRDAPSPSLLLLDLSIGGDKDFGLNVLRSLKAGSDGSEKVPVVVYSSSNDNRDITRCYSNLANCYVWKGTGAQQKKKFKDLISYWSQVATILPPSE
jgi:CheY-like chemotaxis protein